MKRNVLLTALAALLVVAGLVPALAAEEAKPAAPAAAPAPPPPPKYDVQGAQMPPVTLKALKGGPDVTLDKIGKPALILFVNSACSACRAELSALSSLAERVKGKVDSYVVTVDFDPQNTAVRFPDLQAMPYTILDGSDFKAATMLGFTFTPATVLVDGAGVQVLRKGGYSAGDEAGIGKAVLGLAK